VAQALEGAGAQLVPFAFTHEGVTTWSAERTPARRPARGAKG